MSLIHLSILIFQCNCTQCQLKNTMKRNVFKVKWESFCKCSLLNMFPCHQMHIICIQWPIMSIHYICRFSLLLMNNRRVFSYNLYPTRIAGSLHSTALISLKDDLRNKKWETTYIRKIYDNRRNWVRNGVRCSVDNRQ